MRWTKRAPRGALLILTALVASLMIAACGGSSNSGKTTKNAASTSTSKAAASRTAFTTCLKQHGVTLPAGRGGFGGRRFGGGAGTTPSGTSTNGVTITTPSGGSPNGAPPSGGGGFPGGGPGAGGGLPGGGGGFAGGNSKFAKAIQACRSKLPAGSFGQGRFGGGAGARRFTPHISTAALKSYVACVRKNGYPSMPEPDTSTGAKSVFPASVEKNAKFRAASAKCASILRQAFRATAPGAPNTTSTTSTTSNA